MQDGKKMGNLLKKLLGRETGTGEDYYPNGVKKRAFDERLPSGETVTEAVERLMKNGGVNEPLGDLPPISHLPEQISTESTITPTVETPALLPLPTVANSPVIQTPVEDTRPRIVPDQPVTAFPQVRNEVSTLPETKPIYPVLPSQQTQEQINSIYNKDYSKPIYDQEGNLIKPAGANRDKKWSTLEKIGNAAMGALLGLGQGGIGGAIAGGIKGATDRNFNEKLDDKRELTNLYPRLQQQTQAETDATNQRLRNAQAANLELQPVLNQQKLENQTRTVNNRVLSSFYKNNPTFDASNPSEAQVRELASLGYRPEDVGSYNREKPIFANWLGSKFVWDSESGTFKDTGLTPDKSAQLMEITIKNPLTNEVNTYTTTQAKAAQMKQSAANMGYQVIAAKERQASQQTYQSQENEKKRQFELQKQDIAQQMRVQLETIKAANDAAQSEVDATRKAEAQQRAIEAQKEYIRLRAEAKKLEDEQ